VVEGPPGTRTKRISKEAESPPRDKNKHFLWHVAGSFCNCFDSCFSLKLCRSTLSWPPCAFQPSLTSPLDWVEATLDFLCLQQQPARDLVSLFVTASTPVFRWNYFVPLSPGLHVPSNHVWQVRGLSWGHFVLALRQRLGERRTEHLCPHFSRRSHKKPTHVSVSCDSFDSICLVEWSKTELPAPFVPIQDSIHPSLFWLSLLYH
jgi:hypothetical protein